MMSIKYRISTPDGKLHAGQAGSYNSLYMDYQTLPIGSVIYTTYSVLTKTINGPLASDLSTLTGGLVQSDALVDLKVWYEAIVDRTQNPLTL